MGRIKHNTEKDSSGNSKKRGETRKRPTRESKQTAKKDMTRDSRKGSKGLKKSEKQLDKEKVTKKKKGTRQSSRLSNSFLKKAKKRAFEVYEFSDDSLVDSGLGDSIHQPKKGIASSTPSLVGHKTKMSLPKVSPVASASPPLKRAKKNKSPEFHRFSQSIEKRKSFSGKRKKNPNNQNSNSQNEMPILNNATSDIEQNSDNLFSHDAIHFPPEKEVNKEVTAQATKRQGELLEEICDSQVTNVLQADENLGNRKKRKRNSYVGIKKRKQVLTEGKKTENDSENLFTEDSFQNTSKAETDPYSMEIRSDDEHKSPSIKKPKKPVNNKVIQKYKEQEDRIIEEINSLDEYQLVIE
ncbi:DgyrCDS11385 [Dimorphilus gyrociliatus]|uniref:DgyrCDS11385 n=1 Tax=Dimorphilus gyrociliatus TaxID=2664684 RepID=A0A7I8W7U0_9ANNE|nr:DgyrCDS11385 [Dimorphilus gyrociliatus]